MKGEMPVCTRCCFCLPLRYGLLAWGYFKMIADVFIISAMSFSIVDAIVWLRYYQNEVHKTKELNISGMYKDIVISIVLTVIALIVFVTDFVITILFIIGGHKKNVKPLRIFYFFSIAMFILTILFTIALVSITISNMLTYDMSLFSMEIRIVAFSVYFIVLVVQFYFLVLLRSEIIKLLKNCEFRFVNNAAEAECTMKYEGTKGVSGEETETEAID